jgi:hypothetical protein
VKSRRVVVASTTSLRREVKVAGSFVKVVAGAWPSMQIAFDKPATDDTFTNERASPLMNGQVYFPRDKDHFDSFWVTSSTKQGPAGGVGGDDLVLEVYECATPVVVLNDGAGRGQRYHHVAGGNDVTSLALNDTLQLYQDNLWGATGPIDTEANQEFLPRALIGGGISCNNKFTIWILQHLNKNATRKAELARWRVDTLSIDGPSGYCVSFESGGTSRVDTAVAAPTLVGMGPLAWPMFGLTLLLRADAGPLNDTQWVLYSRTP